MSVQWNTRPRTQVCYHNATLCEYIIYTRFFYFWVQSRGTIHLAISHASVKKKSQQKFIIMFMIVLSIHHYIIKFYHIKCDNIYKKVLFTLFVQCLFLHRHNLKICFTDVNIIFVYQDYFPDDDDFKCDTPEKNNNYRWSNIYQTMMKY